MCRRFAAGRFIVRDTRRTVSVAAQRMLERRVQGLLVIDSTRRLAGIVTECDLLAALLG